MCSNKLKIPPPYPDPRRWDEICRLQATGMEMQWMSIRSSHARFQHPVSSNNNQEEGTANRPSTRCQMDSGIGINLREESSRKTYTADDASETWINRNADGGSRYEDSMAQMFVQEETFDKDTGGEMVDTLEMNDFWIKRLSRTVKRMNKKYNRITNH